MPFAHRLYHFVFAFSRWEYAELLDGGESFEALSKGLQNALWQASGAPHEHRTDSLSAAFKNLKEEENFTARYTARLYSDRLDCYLSGALVLTLARGVRSPLNGRGRMIDYRHFIDALKRKPQAFKGLVFRDALFPREAYRRTGSGSLRSSREPPSLPEHGRVARTWLAMDGIEAVLAQRLDALLVAGELPNLRGLREEFAPRQTELPQIAVKSHLGTGIGHALIEAGYRVLFMRTSEMVQRLQAPA